jgi:GNAT superfamily N-acetyltransferase
LVPDGFSPVEKLTGDHELSGFDCGRQPMNDWLRRYALVSQDSLTTFAVCPARSKLVAGYYTLSTGAVEELRQAPPSVTATAPSWRPVLVMILVRLAVDLRYQRRKLGRGLLADALIRVDGAADHVGVRALMLHALDEQARSFYLKFGFEQSPLNAFQLFLPVQRIRASLQSAALRLRSQPQ